MHIKKCLFTVILLMAFIAGCSLDPPIYPDVINITATDLSTYFPTDKQATWEYEVERESGKTTEDHTLSGETVDIDETSYFTVTINPASTEEIRYFNKTGGVYTMRAVAPVNGESISLQYLKDNAQIGDSWIGQINDGKSFEGAPARTQTIVRETELTRIVSGKRYSNVTHTQVEIQHNVGNGMQTFAVYHFYVAKGIGIVELSIDFENKTVANYYLKNYRVK